MKVAYFDCFSGISGDMVLGALVDLGVPLGWLEEQLGKIPLGGFSLTESRVERGHIRGRQVQVRVEDKESERAYGDIRRLIEGAQLPEPVREKGAAVFERLAEAEAFIHGCNVEEVHFHEVGGIDAIVDVVGAVLGLQYLGVDRIAASPLALGTGMVSCRHGLLPLPAPAAVELLKDLPVYGTAVDAELVTPTGAALLSVLAEEFGPLPAMRIQRVGYGAGQRELTDRPNLLRVMIGDALGDSPAVREEEVAVLETSIDDMNPELFGFLMERLFGEGAVDVCWIPVYMKKNRPGTLVQVICPVREIARLSEILLVESTTTGVRSRKVHRRSLVRKSLQLETPFGPVRAKEIRLPGGSVRVTPEYEECRKIALENGLPLPTVYEQLQKIAAEAAALGRKKDKGQGPQR